MRGQKKKRPISKIGRRTGADILEGKLVRQNKDGVDNFNDYFTDQESVCLDQTTQSMVSFVKNNSGWTSSLDNNSISPLKSPLKEILNKRNEGFEGDFSDSNTSEHSRRPKVSKKKLMPIEEHSENINFAISKMTQTSHLLDETASKNRTFLKETNFDESSGIKNSIISKSSILPDTSVAPYNIQDIHLSTNDANCASSHDKPNKGHESYIDETRKSLSNTEKSGKISILRETSRNKYDSFGKEKNSVTERSLKAAAMSSEVSKLEKKKSSKNRKSRNKSEVFVSSQKENKENSSARKSSCNLIQISNNSRSQEKAEPKKDSPRRKIDSSKITEDVLQEKKKSPYSLRRSSRRRFPPLAFWRNERPMFMKATSGNITCVGVDAGQPEDDFAFRILKKRHERKPFKSSKIKKQDLLKRIRKTKILDSVLGRELKLNLHRPFIACEWFPREGEDSKPYGTSSVFSSDFLSSGFLDIPGYSRKGESHSPLHNIYFIVLKGVVDVVIGKTRFTFKKFDCFIVPLRAMYSISNNASANALLHYCAIKSPIFKYQGGEL